MKTWKFDFLFTAYYYNGNNKSINVIASNRTKAYELARKKAIKLNNNLDIIELDNIINL